MNAATFLQGPQVSVVAYVLVEDNKCTSVIANESQLDRHTVHVLVHGTF